jgi:hypothetical protein
MELFGKILRTICLSLLFGGSVGIVIAAIVLVDAAVAHGTTRAAAAATNAPIFLIYSKVNLAAGICLLLGESIDFASRRLWNRATIFQYTASLLCVASTMIFSLGIVPPMEQLLPSISSNPAAHEQFAALHHASRIVFGATIVLALISLLLPLFGAMKSTPAAEVESP